MPTHLQLVSAGEREILRFSNGIALPLTTYSKGNRKVEVTAHSPCQPGAGLCGERSTNR